MGQAKRRGTYEQRKAAAIEERTPIILAADHPALKSRAIGHTQSRRSLQATMLMMAAMGIHTR